MLHAPKQLAWVTWTCSAVKPAARSFAASTSPKGSSACHPQRMLPQMSTS